MKKQPTGYEVVKRPYDAEGARNCTDFVVSWYGDASKPKAIVRLFSDGCIKFVWTDEQRIKLGVETWFYHDEAQGIHEALGEALRLARKRYNRRPSQAELYEFVGGKHQLDLDRDETVKLLRTIRWRKREAGGVEIEYEGKWLHLCRTDLVDDVRTWTEWDSEGDYETLKYYAERVAYGARITDDAFFVVDAMTDG